MKKSFSDDFHQFVELCLNKNPLSRWAASKLMTHSFLKQCRCTSLAEHFKDFNHDLSKCKLKERMYINTTNTYIMALIKFKESQRPNKKISILNAITFKQIY